MGKGRGRKNFSNWGRIVALIGSFGTISFKNAGKAGKCFSRILTQ